MEEQGEGGDPCSAVEVDEERKMGSAVEEVKPWPAAEEEGE